MELIRRELIYLWYYFSVQLEQIALWWVLGMLIGSAVSVFAKGRINAAFERLGASRAGTLAVVPAALLGICSPLCMYGTIPIAVGFSRGGVRDELIAAFMITGPATKITNLGALKIVLGARNFAVYIAYTILFALATGLITNLIFQEVTP